MHDFLRLIFSNGETPNTGYSNEGFIFKSFVTTLPHYILLLKSFTTTDPNIIYPIEPLYESIDSIENRHTRRVYSNSAEMIYSGKWNDEEYDAFFKRTVKSSEITGNAIEFSFNGANVYWRAMKGPDCGKADVFIDGAFQKTVDCYSNPSTEEQIAFMKTGLDSKKVHTIKVVVRGEKNTKSKGTTVRNLLFEYSAESYRASDGFSSIQGKNCWYYQQKRGTNYVDMTFEGLRWVGDKCDNYDFENAIEYYNTVVVTNDVARKWVAPHAGTVRIEGSVEFYSGFLYQVGEVQSTIFVNDKEVWPAKMIKLREKLSHDITLKINKGDAIYFVVKGDCKIGCGNVAWDPVVTYVDGTGEIKLMEILPLMGF